MAAITLDALVIEGGIFEVVVRDGVFGTVRVSESRAITHE